MLLATPAGGLVAVPADYRERFIHYATIERPAEDLVRYLYINPEALVALGQTRVLPEGTLIVMEAYQLAHDAQGVVLRDGGGQPIPGALRAIVAKQQVTGSQVERLAPVAEAVRNGAWVYAEFDPTTGNTAGFNRPLCHACHSGAQASAYLFTFAELSAFVQAGGPQYTVCDRPARQPCDVPGQE